jgi:ATP-binding cassette subfamily C protein CydD
LAPARHRLRRRGRAARHPPSLAPGNAIDGAIFRGAGLAQSQPWLWLLLGAIRRPGLLVWGTERAAVQGAVRIKVALRDRLYRHIQGLGPRWLADRRTGALASDLIQGIEGLTAYYARFLPAMALTLAIPAAILVVVFPLDWLSGLICC